MKKESTSFHIQNYYNEKHALAYRYIVNHNITLSVIHFEEIGRSTLTVWERSIVCHGLYSGNRFIAHQFLQCPIQSRVFLSFIAFILDFRILVVAVICR